MATLTDLDEHTLARIVELAGGPYFVTGLRGASREVRARIRAPAHCFSDTLLREGARDCNWRLCILARNAGASDVNTMLCAAAFNGHREICELAIGWGARNFDEMRKYARNGGYGEMVIFPQNARCCSPTNLFADLFIDSHIRDMFATKGVMSLRDFEMGMWGADCLSTNANTQ